MCKKKLHMIAPTGSEEPLRYLPDPQPPKIQKFQVFRGLGVQRSGHPYSPYWPLRAVAERLRTRCKGYSSFGGPAPVCQCTGMIPRTVSPFWLTGFHFGSSYGNHFCLRASPRPPTWPPRGALGPKVPLGAPGGISLFILWWPCPCVPEHWHDPSNS